MNMLVDICICDLDSTRMSLCRKSHVAGLQEWGRDAVSKFRRGVGEKISI